MYSVYTSVEGYKKRTTIIYVVFVHFVVQVVLVHGSHLEQRIFAGTKWLGRYQVQISRFMAQVIVFVIINAMISYDSKIGIMEESKKSQYKYCLKKREFIFFATNNNMKGTS